MSIFEAFHLPKLPGLPELPDFDPIGLLGDSHKIQHDFQPPGFASRHESGMLDFSGNIYRDLPQIREVPFDILNSRFAPSDFLSAGMKNPRSGEGLFGGMFGDALGGLSHLFSNSENLTKHGLFGGAEEIGGILGHITNPVKGLFSGLGDAGSKLGGILGSVGHFLGPIGGILGGITGGAQEGVKGLLSSVAGGFSFGGPIGAGIMGLAHITGLDKLAGKALGGIVDGVKSVGSTIGHGLASIGKGIGHLFGF